MKSRQSAPNLRLAAANQLRSADWFNGGFSGYSDQSANGDRTAFDRTAEKLDFTFAWALSLGAASNEYSQGASETFPGAAFAQDSTGVCSNRWFLCSLPGGIIWSAERSSAPGSSLVTDDGRPSHVN